MVVENYLASSLDVIVAKKAWLVGEKSSYEIDFERESELYQKSHHGVVLMRVIGLSGQHSRGDVQEIFIQIADVRPSMWWKLGTSKVGQNLPDTIRPRTDTKKG